MEFSEAALQQARERRLLIDRFDSWIFEAIEPFIGRRVLEIGCGAGNLTSHLLGRDLVIGIDISAENVERVNATYSEHSNVQAVVADASDPSLLQLRDNAFDTIISLNVLEHIEDDVVALRIAHDILVPGGRMILIVPAHQQLYGTMDSSIGHFRRYSQEDVVDKLLDAGLEVVSSRYMNPIGALGWFVNGQLLRRQVAPAGQLKLFNHLVPLVTAIDRMLPWPFGLSVLAIAERPTEALPVREGLAAARSYRRTVST